MNPITRFLFILAFLASHNTYSAGEAESPGQLEVSSRFHPYTHCDGFAGGVRGVTLDRRPPDAAPWREVGFGGKTERVSVVDGYRVTYTYPRTYSFANLRAERSDPSKYNEDKRIVTENLETMAREDGNTALVNFSGRGISGQTLTKKELAGTTLAITQIFSDEDSIIVTIFFPNHAPEDRHFQTHEEFISLRDRFVRGYIECVAKKRSASISSQKR